MTLPTVSIDTDNGPVLINHSAYDAATHTLTDPQPEGSALFAAPKAPAVVAGEPGAPLAPLAPLGEPGATVPPANVDTAAIPVAPGAPGEPTPPPAPPVPAAPVETFVTKLDNAWFVTGADGKAIDGKNGEDGKGYGTKKDAEAANK